MALHQEVPDGGGAGVDLFADAVASATLHIPGVAMAADVAREALGLDGHDTAGADQHVVDVTSARAEHDVIDETVVVRQSTEGIGDDALAEASVACVPQAAYEFGRENDRPNAEYESEASVRDHGRGQGGEDDRRKASPEALLAPCEVTAADLDDTHRSEILPQLDGVEMSHADHRSTRR